MWDTLKWSNVKCNYYSRRRDRAWAQSTFDEIIAENFPKCMMNINSHIQETKLTPNMKNTKKNPPRHVTSNC